MPYLMLKKINPKNRKQKKEPKKQIELVVKISVFQKSITEQLIELHRPSF